MNTQHTNSPNLTRTRNRKTVLISPEAHRHLLNVHGKLHGRRCELNLSLDSNRQLPELCLGELMDLLILSALDKLSDPLLSKIG